MRWPSVQSVAVRQNPGVIPDCDVHSMNPLTPSMSSIFVYIVPGVGPASETAELAFPLEQAATHAIREGTRSTRALKFCLSIIRSPYCRLMVSMCRTNLPD